METAEILNMNVSIFYINVPYKKYFLILRKKGIEAMLLVLAL